VDAPSVRTVPSDFAEQDIQTDTQAARVEREEQAAEEEAEVRARAEADLARKKARAGRAARRADNWLTKHLESMGEGPARAVAAANLLAVVGLSGWLGFKAWALYDRGRLGWREMGIGLGVLGAVGAVEGVFAK
jgi:hypothetical protein